MKPELNLNRSLCIMVLIFSCLVSCTDYATAEFTTEDLDDAIAAMNKKGENTLGLEILQNYQSMDTGFYSVYTKDSITNMKGTFSEVNEAIIKFSNTIQPGMYVCQHELLGFLNTYLVHITRENVYIIKCKFMFAGKGSNLYLNFYPTQISDNLAYTFTQNGDLLLSSGSILRPFKDQNMQTVGFTNPDGKLFIYREDEKRLNTYFKYNTSIVPDYIDAKQVTDVIKYQHDFLYDQLSPANEALFSRYVGYFVKNQY